MFPTRREPTAVQAQAVRYWSGSPALRDIDASALVALAGGWSVVVVSSSCELPACDWL